MLTTIHITVRDRVPTITAGEDVISHNSDYVAEFEFDEEWQDKVKTVYFVCEDGSYQAVVMSGNSCGVPMLDGEHRRIFVGVQAGAAEKPSVLKTTRPCCLKVKDSIADYLGQPIPDPTPDVYEQIIAMLESITSPTWDSVQNKPFSTLGSGLVVDENGVLSAEGGSGGSSAFYINITSTTDDTGYTTYSADKTADEIIAAYESGAVIIGVYGEFYMPCERIITDTTYLTLIFWIQGVDYIHSTVVDRQFSVNINIDNKEMDVSYQQNEIMFDKGIVFRVNNNTIQTSPNSGSFREILQTIDSAIQLSKSIDVILLKGSACYNLSRLEESRNGELIKFDDVANSKTYIVFADVKNKAFTYSEEPLSTSVKITYNEETGNLQIGG